MTAVMLVDDHPVFRRGLASLLTAEGMRVVAEASSGAEAAALAVRVQPDVVVMDLGLPDTDGLTLTREVLDRCPQSHVIVVSMYHDDAALARALEAGARGYVPKDAPPEDVVAAIRLVAAGGVAVSPQLAPRIARLVAGGVVRSTAVDADRFPALSPRERQVLGLLADGLSNAAIAERIGVATKTVANYVSSLCVQLGVTDRRAAAEMASQARDASKGGRLGNGS
jgi:DNA-binding NarL/FixJ family response regulator